MPPSVKRMLILSVPIVNFVYFKRIRSLMHDFTAFCLLIQTISSQKTKIGSQFANRPSHFQIPVSITCFNVMLFRRCCFGCRLLLQCVEIAHHDGMRMLFRPAMDFSQLSFPINAISLLINAILSGQAVPEPGYLRRVKGKHDKYQENQHNDHDRHIKRNTF